MQEIISARRSDFYKKLFSYPRSKDKQKLLWYILENFLEVRFVGLFDILSGGSGSSSSSYTGRSSYSGKSNLIAGTDTGAGRKIGKKIGGVIGEKVGGESGKKIGEAVGEGIGLIIER